MNSISICRNFQHMDHITFKEDLVSKLCVVPSGDSPDQLLSRFYSAIISVLDKHAPLKTKSHKLRPKEMLMLRDVWEGNMSENGANLELKLIGWLTKLKGIESIKWLMPVRLNFTGLLLLILKKKRFLRLWILCLTKTTEFFLNVILPRFLQWLCNVFQKQGG